MRLFKTHPSTENYFLGQSGLFPTSALAVRTLPAKLATEETSEHFLLTIVGVRPCGEPHRCSSNGGLCGF